MTTYQSVLDALGEPSRRLIIDELGDGPLTVGSLADRLPVSRPAVSQHLRHLLEAGLVTYESAGTRHVYRFEPRGLRPLSSWITDVWPTALDSFAAFADEQHTHDKDMP